jgi:insulysin
MKQRSTEKFPDENEYSSYLSAHGGYDNAYTADEDTNYFFAVNADALDGALDRFAQFFIAPLLKETSVDKEMNAVNNENQKNLRNDAWRLWQLVNTVSKTEHPFSRFSTGNLKTLNKTGVRDALLGFHEKFYSANRMRLVVYGKESPDELLAMVARFFSNVPNKNIGLPSYDAAAPYDIPPPVAGRASKDAAAAAKPATATAQDVAASLPPITPGASKVTGIDISALPIKELDRVSVYWPLPAYSKMHMAAADDAGGVKATTGGGDDSYDLALTTPAPYMSFLLGHEGGGSILHRLTALGYATGLSAGTQAQDSDFLLYGIDVELTKKGLAHTNEVLDIIYAYLQMMWLTPLSAHAAEFNNLKSLDHANFFYQEKGNPMSYTKSLASAMHYIRAPELLGSDERSRFDAVAFTDALRRLQPGNAVTVTVSRAFIGGDDAVAGVDTRDLPMNEVWYGTNYTSAVATVDAMERRVFASPNVATAAQAAGVHMPRKNLFIPDSFDLVPADAGFTAAASGNGKAPVVPTFVRAADGTGGPPGVKDPRMTSVLWHHHDLYYKMPRTYFNCELEHDAVFASAAASINAQLYIHIVAELLKETAYESALGGAAYSLSSSVTGFTFSSVSYSNLHAAFVSAVTRMMAPPGFDAADSAAKERAFAKAVESMQKSLANARVAEPRRHAAYFERLLTRTPSCKLRVKFSVRSV